MKDILADLIPKEQTRVKTFRQQHGKTVVGQITVDMVRGWAFAWKRGSVTRFDRSTTLFTDRSEHSVPHREMLKLMLFVRNQTVLFYRFDS